MNICDKNASCSNTLGSYSCVCNPKYIGDGLTCKVDICQVHTVLQDDDRDVRKQSSQNAKCDKNLKTGWYRFLNIPGITMATECPQVTGTCGTTYPGWFDGDHPTVDEGEVERTVCFRKGLSRYCQASWVKIHALFEVEVAQPKKSSTRISSIQIFCGIGFSKSQLVLYNDPSITRR